MSEDAIETLSRTEATKSPRAPKGILALDIDGTLTGDGGKIGERTRRAVHAAGESGWLVTIATGRAWSGTKPVADQLALRVPLISFNGALVRDSVTAEILHYIPLSPEIVGTVVPALVERGLQPLVVEDIRRGERRFTGPPEYDDEHIADLLALLQRVNVDIRRVPYEELARIGHAVHISVVVDAARLPELEPLSRGNGDKFRALVYDEPGHATRPAQRLVQYLHPSSTKAEALRWLTRQYGLTMADVVAVGDGVNDLEMLTEAGFGVAMGNAGERVRAEAELVIGHHLDEGLAAFIEEHLIDAPGVPALNRLVG